MQGFLTDTFDEMQMICIADDVFLFAKPCCGIICEKGDANANKGNGKTTQL